MTSQEADTYNLDWRCHCLLINLKCGEHWLLKKEWQKTGGQYRFQTVIRMFVLCRIICWLLLNCPLQHGLVLSSKRYFFHNSQINLHIVLIPSFLTSS